MLFFDDRLKGIVKQFSKGMDGASTIGANRTGADRSLMNLDCQVEVLSI